MIQYLKRSLTPLSTVTVPAFLRLTRGGRKGAAEKSHIETSAPDVRSSQSRLRYFTIYTAVFMTALFLCFGIYLMGYKKTILRETDTFNQQYITFIRIGQWIREMIRERRVLVWDPSIGYGADFFLTLSSSNQGSIFDPFMLVSVFTPPRYSEIIFTAIVFLRLYLCGITFSLLAFRKKSENYAALCGAMVYTFSACAYVGLYQTPFIVPMYMLPLIIYGAEELFENGNPLLYSVSLTAMAVWSYYFTYMIAFMIAGHIFLSWAFGGPGEHTLSRFLEIAGRFLLYSFLSAGMAAFILFPVAKNLMGMDRFGLETYIPFLYDKTYYAGLLAGLTSSFDMLRRDCKVGWSVFVLIASAGLFLTREKKYRLLKTELIIMALALCFPYAGSVMNGFAYAANRWVFGLSLAAAYAVTVMLPEIRQMERKKIIKITAVICLYFMAVLLFCGVDRLKYLVIFLFTLAVCLILSVSDRIPDLHFKGLMVMLVCTSLAISSYYQYSKGYENGFGSGIEAGTAYEQLTKRGGLTLLKKIPFADGERYNTYKLDVIRNSGWLYQKSGMNFYFSGYNSFINRFHNSVALRAYAYPHAYNGLDRRSELLALTSVGHFLVPSGNLYRPVGFGEAEAEADSYGTAVTSLKADIRPSAFLRFDQAVSYEEYESYTPYERQQILMQACVVEDAENISIGKKLRIEDESVPYTVDNLSDGLKVKGNTIEVAEGSGTLELLFSRQKDAELYLYFDNIEFENGLESTYNVEAAGMLGEKVLGNVRNSFSGMNYRSHSDGGKRNWLMNLGRVKKSCDRIRITFNNAGIYTIDHIKVYARPVAGIHKNIRELDHVYGGVEFGTNTMSVKITSDHPEYLFASVPYSEGWTVADRGEKLDLLRADEGFMAVRLDEGNHELRFAYHTPGLKTGLLISLLSAACFFLTAFYHLVVKNSFTHAKLPPR